MTGEITLSELQLIIRDSIYLALPDFYWVIAEISEANENYAGHCYLELIEKQPDETNIKARVKAIIWNTRYRFLKPLFESSTGESLKPGMKILVRVKVEYHEIYSLSLIVSDIDPSFTVGEMTLKRQQIIRKLKEEGVFSMNKELVSSSLPKRIAVVSSANAAGYLDFITHLKENKYGYIFFPVLFETVMQGTETEKSIVSSLFRIAEYEGLFDAVVIIRGGGSQSDLGWFDNYNIAYHITQFPIPVLTGIGHEKDLTIADMVASHSFKTPTAVADYLIECYVLTETRLGEITEKIKEKTESMMNYNLELISNFRMRIIPSAKLLLSTFKEKLSLKMMELTSLGKAFISGVHLVNAAQGSRIKSSSLSYAQNKRILIERKKLDLQNLVRNKLLNSSNLVDMHKKALVILDPDNILRRGFTITMVNGKAVRSSLLVETGDMLETRFHDGEVKSRVTR